MTTRGALVGRADELAALEAALEDALDGLGRLVVLRGEAGIGKTRLASEIAARGAAAGAVVLWGRALDEAGAPTAWPLVEVLRAAVTAPALTAARGALETARDGLARAGDPDARFAVLDGAATALAAAAREAALVVVLDDLHWADPATLTGTKLLVRALARSRALVVATHRPREARLSPEALRSLTELERDGELIAPAPLSTEDVGALAATSGVDAGWAARVRDKTDGNPFLVEQTLRWIATAGAAPGDALPDTDGARAIVGRRLERLPAEARRVVEVAAAIGAGPDRALLAEAIAEPRFEAALATAIEHGVLEARDGELRFTHDLMRETVRATTADPVAVHAAIAAALERRGGDPGELARHRAASGDPRAADAAIEGARVAGRRGDDLEAAALLGLAIGALRARGEAPDRREVELAIERGERLLRAGVVTEGAQQCAEAGRLARGMGAPDLLARAALAHGSVVRLGRVDPTLVELLEQALDETTGDAARAPLEARLAAALQPSPTPEVPLARARHAIATARGLGDEALLLRVIDLARPAFRALDDLDERLALDREALALAVAQGDVEAAIRAERRLSIDLLEQGDLAAHDRHAAQVAAHTEEPRWIGTRFSDATFGLSRALLTGEPERAERALRHAADQFRALPDPDAVVGMNPLPMMRVLWLRARRRVEDRPLLASIEVPPSPMACLVRTVRATALEDRAAAAAELDAVFTSADHLRLNYLAAALLPETIAWLGDAARAAAMLPLIEPLAGRNVIQFAGICEGAAGRLLGMLHRTVGRTDDARRCFETALAANTAIGARPFVHLTELALAELLLARRPRDPEGLAHLARAVEGFAALEMTASLARARALRCEDPERPRAEPSADAPPLATLRREGDVWTLAHDGAEHRLKDAHGLSYLAHLLARPGEPVSVEALFAVIPRGDVMERSDAGPVLDDAAKRAYRARLADLRERLAEAEAFCDLGRAAAARAEMEALHAELVRAVGLGGRDRRAASRAERTRVNVTLRIRKTIQRIAALAPAVGHHLERSVTTGAFCGYDPPPGPRVTT